MAIIAPGFGEEGKLNPLGPIDPDPKKKPIIAPGFGQEDGLPSPAQRSTESGRLSRNYIAQSDLENYMAGNQSGLELFGKVVGQAVPNAILGTVEAVSYLGDFEQMMEKLKGDEKEYTNWLAESMKKAKESIAQDSPLKVFQSAESREGFAPGDATWWAGHSPDVIGSVLSLVIPAAGVAGLVGKGAKALKMGAGATQISKGLAATVTSRYAESTMEANNMYQRAYKELTDRGVSPEVARIQAGEQASNLWNTNWIFAVQDFMQYSTLLKGFASAAKGSIGKTIGEVAKQTVSEAGEEAGQFIAGEEAYGAAVNKDMDYFGEGFQQRLYEYIRDPEFKAATLLGAAGGGVFSGMGPLAGAAQKGGEYAAEAIQSAAKKLFGTGLAKERANYAGDTGTSQAIDDITFTEGLFQNLKEGKLANYKQDLENLKQTQELAPEVRTNLDKYTEDIDFIADEQAKLKSAAVPEDLHTKILATKLEQRQLGRMDNQLTGELTNLKQEVVNNKELAPELTQLKELQANLEGYKKLAATNPKFKDKVVALEKEYKTLEAGAELAFPNLKEALTTSRDNDIFEKSYQLLSTKEKMVAVKQELVKLSTPEGIAETRRQAADKAVNEEATAVLKNPKATKEEILQAAANATDENLKLALAKKHQYLTSRDQEKNEAEVKDVVETQIPEASPELSPEGEFLPPELDPNMEVVPDITAPTNIESIPFAGGLTPEQAQKWGGLSKSQVDDLLERVDIEQKKPKEPAVTEQKEKDQNATETRQRTTVPAWLKEVEDSGSKTVYTNYITGEEATADKVFATDPQTGQLLANTPIVKIGDQVILKLERDHGWILKTSYDKGFRPNAHANYIINVYLPGNPKPIKQLPSADNKRLVEQKVLHDLRNKVIQEGTVTTTITGKNVGTIRNTNTLQTIEVLESDFVEVGGEWIFKMMDHNPVFGFIDFSGNPVVPNMGAMRGITDDVINKINDSLLVQRSNDLAKIKGRVVTWRTAPDGSKRMVTLEPRQLNQEELVWLEKNLPQLIATKDFTTLSSVVHIPQHEPGVYSTKNGTKKPDVLKLDRRRIHVVNVTTNSSDILIPLKSKENKPIWIILDSKELPAFLAAQPFTFKTMGPEGTRSAAYTNHPKQGEIVERFKKLLSEQFKNVNKDNLNSEIRYTNPINPDESFDSYYDYLVKTGSVQTNLPGSKTLGVGDDSSYSFNQVAVYVDPYPQTAKSTVEEGGTIIHAVPPEPIVPPVTTEKVTPNVNPLDEFFGPKLKPVVEGDFKVITEKELQWFKDTIGEEFLVVAKGVDSFVAANGIEAFGQYYNSLVTLADFAPAGTGYHEAGHFVLDPNNKIVTEQEKEKILEEGSKVYGIARSHDVKVKTKSKSVENQVDTEAMMEAQFEEVKNDLADPTAVFASQQHLYFDPNAPIEVEVDPFTELPVEASTAAQEPTTTSVQIKDYFDEYEKYFRRRYTPSDKYTGPRKKGELKNMLDTLEANLKSSYISVANQENVVLDRIPTPGELVPVTTRFLKNIKKNLSHSTNLDRPFQFKDATPKENEILGEFYNFIVAELQDFSKKTNKAMPKAVPNERLAEKLAFWLAAKYGLQTYSAPADMYPYGLHNIIKNDVIGPVDDDMLPISSGPIVTGGEVFVSDGLHFPTIASGHNKLLGLSGVRSNTLGWFIEAQVENDLFLYEFQSDILPEIESGSFKFSTEVVQDTDTSVKLRLTLPQMATTYVTIDKNTTTEAELTKLIQNQLKEAVETVASDIANRKVHAERHMRGDDLPSISSQENKIKNLVQQASEPDVNMLAEFLMVRNKNKFLKKLVDEDINKPDFLQILVDKLGRTAGPVIQALQSNAPVTKETIGTYKFNNREYDTQATQSFLEFLLTLNPFKNRYYKPKGFKKNITVSDYFIAQNKRQNDLIKQARTIQKKILSQKTKQRVSSKDPGLIDNYYKGREQVIYNYYKNEFEQELGRNIEAVVDKLKFQLTDVTEQLAKKDVTTVTKSLPDLQKDYEHWYKIMFDKFIRISLIRAKASGRKQVYLPTYHSMKAIEGSGKTGRIYATPHENVDEILYAKYLEEGEFKVGELLYMHRRSDDKYFKAHKDPYVRTIDLVDDREGISQEEFEAAAAKLAKSKAVGPFYSALSKIKGIKIQGLVTPAWSKQPLLSVDISEFNDIDIERFKTVEPDALPLSGDAQIEEEIMKEFEQYKLTDGKYKPKVAQAKGFFKKLWLYIKKLLGYKSSIERLFSTIDNLALSPEQKLGIQQRARGMVDPGEARYKKLPGFKFIKQQVESVSAFSSEVIRIANDLARQTEIDLSELLTKKETIDTIFGSVKANFEADFNRIKASETKSKEDTARYYSYLAMGIGEAEVEEANYVGSYEDTTTATGFPSDGFKTKVLKDLARYGFRVRIGDKTIYENPDEEESQSEENLELKQTDEGERLYDIDHTLINPSKSLSQRVRLFLATIPEPIIGTDEVKKTIFGTTKFLDFRKVDGNLALKLRDSINPITRLTELAKNDPISKVVLDALMSEKNKGNNQLFNEFAAKYNRDGYYKKTILYGTEIVPIERGSDPENPTATSALRFFAKTIDSDRASSDRTLHNRWREEGVRKKITDTDGTVNVPKATALNNSLLVFETKFFAAKRSKNRLPFDEVKDEFNRLLGEIGVVLDPKVWQEFNEIDNPGIKYKKLEDLFFKEKDRSLKRLLEDAKDGKDPFEGGTVLNTLAKISSAYLEDSRGGAYRNDSGNQENPINWPSALTELANQIKNNPREVFEFYTDDNFYKDNQFLLAIKSNSDKIDLNFTSVIRRNEDDPKEFEDRGEIESMLMRFTTFYNNGGNEGFFFTGTPADKTKQPIISLPKYKGTKDSKDFLFTVLKNTMNSEVVRIQRIKNSVGIGNQQTPLPSDISSYKEAIQFKYIPGLNNVPNLVEQVSAGQVNPEQFKVAMSEAEKVIDNFIDTEFSAFKTFLAENDVIKIDSVGNITTERIPKGILAGRELDAFLKEFFYNDLAWRLEISKVIMGDIAFYKNADDYFKRAYQTVTPGLKGYSEQPKTAVRGVYAKQMKINTPEYLDSLVGLGASKETVARYGTPEHPVNKTDAQSLSDIDTYKMLSESFGQWSPDHERVYNIAWSKGITIRNATRQLIDQNLITEEQGKELRANAARILLQPLKPFQYKTRKVTLPDGKVMIIKEQFKDSITPITPELTNIHKGYKDLLAFMKHNKIGIMSAEDTVKVGSYGVITDISQPVQDWQKRVVNLEDFKFPQLLPDKKKEDIKGTQFHKLILGNIDDATMYVVGRTKMLGATIKKKYNELWAQKIQDSSETLQKKLGVGSNFKLSEDPAKRRDQLFKLKTVLEQELLSRDLNENYQDLLDLIRLTSDQLDFTLPISFPAFGQKFQSIMTNLWKKNVLAQDSPGYAAVNLADFGVGYDDELKFITNKDGEVTEAEIGLPIDYLSDLGLKYGTHILPNGRIIWDQLSKTQQEALQFILYRIPTSNKSSMLPVRVVKIVPSNLNNVVMIPGELTVQQGLDFDVDKSQLLRRVLKDGKIDDNIDNSLFDIYWSILTSKEHIQELLTPLATPTLEAKFKEYEAKGLMDLGVSSSVASTQADVKAEIRNKDGKAEIGIASRFNTGHVVMQTIKNYIQVNVGIDISIGKYKLDELGRKFDANGTLISENHAEGQQAALDSAKNPLLAYFHIVTGTMAAFHTMLDFGTPLGVATDFFMQPVVKEWTKFFKQEGLNQRKATEKLFATYPAIKNQYLQIADGKVRQTLSAEGLSQYLTSSLETSTSHDAKVLMEFLKIMNIAGQLTKINNVLSIDTFQDMTGIEAVESFIQQKNDVVAEDALIRLDTRIFDLDTTPDVGKRLAAFYTYGVENALAYSSQFFPAATNNYRNVRNYFAQSIGEIGLSDKLLIKQLNQAIDYFNLEGDSLLSRTLTAIHPQPEQPDYRQRWAFFSPSKSIWKYVDSITQRYPDLKTNELIRNLETKKVNQDQVQMVGIRNTDNNTNKTEVTNGWYELLHHPAVEVRGLGHDLVRFAIWTTAFNFNHQSMFELIPVQFWVESGLGTAWRNVVTTAESTTLDKEAIVVNFIRHNFKNIERFPELYGKFTKEKGFQSDMILNVKADGRHITEFNLSKSYLQDRLPTRFMRFNDNEIGDYRLYESDPNNELHFKEVQPSGEKNAYYEVSATGREVTKHPKNLKVKASTDPWATPTPVTTSYPLIGNIGGKVNPYVAQYLPEDKTSAETLLKKLIEDETDVEGKRGLEALLRNVAKISTPIELEELQGKLGVFEVYEDGTNAIKINPKGNVKSEGMIRHILGHELHHGFSVGVIQSPEGERQINFVRNLDRIRKESGYDVDNYEFIAELASNSKFRQELRGKGLWSRILRAFRNLLGMTDKYDKLLDEYYKVLDEAETLQKITPSEYAMKEEEVKPVGKKRIDLLQQMIASLKAREDRLRSKGRRAEAKKLGKDIKVLEELSKTKRNEAVVRYLITVEEEMTKLKNAYNLMAKDPSRVNPDALYSMREQLVSYKLLDAFSDQIHLNPDNFVPTGGDSNALLKSLDDLRADVHKMSNSTRRLAIQRFASVIKSTLNDPNITMASIVDQLEVADRDIDWINRWTDVGMEMDDAAVRTAHKMLTDNTLNAYRAIQDDLYNNIAKPQEAIVSFKNKEGKWDKRLIKFTSHGMMQTLSNYEAWLKSIGKNPNSITDKFAPVIDQSSLEQNDDGVHLIAPWSPEGKQILAIKPGSKDYPLRQFYETFVMGYLKSQENIPARNMRPGLRVPSIQRSMLEGIINENGTDKLSVLKEAAIDSVRKRYDETDFKAVDENGKPQEYIPVRFIAKQDGKEGRLATREVSLDIASTLPLFIHEMYSRQGLEQLHADLELGKLVLGEREVMKTKRISGPGLVPWLTREREGITLASGKFETIKGEQSQSFAAYDSLLRRFLYGEVKKSEGDIQKGKNKFSVSKIVDSLIGLTGFKVMFGNIAIPLTNAIVGELTMTKEVVGGNLINMKDYAYANKFFGQVALPSIQDVGRREKKTKAGRILTYFNPLDNNRAVGDLGVDTTVMRSIWHAVSRSGNGSVEFYLGSKAIGATFNRFKAKNSAGEEVSFYDAIEVSNSGKVQLSDGYTYKGNKSITPADINEIRNYALRVYQLMNGVYNKMDKSSANEYIAGRLLFFMRNWLVPGLQARWKTKHYDERLQKENEGHYLSALVAFNNNYTKKGAFQGTIDNLRILTWFGSNNPELLLLPNELTLSQEEKDNIIQMRKANIRKTLFEIYTIIGLTAIMGLAWDDDDESYTKYMLARVRREMSTFYSPSTAWDVLRSPTVALNLIDGFTKIQGDLVSSAGAVITGEDQPKYEQGPYKGENKLGADLKRQFGFGFEKQFDDLDTKTRLIQRGGFK